jgi:CBS domain-containing protein
MNTEDLVIDLSTIARCGENETVGSALSLVNHDHQPIFVFNKQEDFLGLISPFEILFRRRLPYTTKISSALIMPPKFTSDSDLYEMVNFILSSRIYTIPIFDQDEIKIIGQITVRDLLRNLIADKQFLSELGRAIEIHKPITINQSANINEAYQLLRQNKISRVITVNDENKTVGIISRSDIVYAFIKPTPKQRSSSRGGQPVNYSFDEEDIRRIDKPVGPYQSLKLNSVQESENISKKMTTLINSKFDELVIVDRNKIPMGIITYRDVLLAVLKLKPQEQINIIFEKPSSNVSKEGLSDAHELLNGFGDKTNKRDPLERIKISFEEPKTPHGDTILFNTTLKVFFLDGNYYVATTKELEFLDGVKSAIDQINKQIRRDTRNRHH